jgi:hypothetical protein
MPILFSKNSLSSYLRIASTILVLGVILNLFFLGAQPIAINLVPSPWDKFVHGTTYAVLAFGIGLASGLQSSRMMIAAFLGALLIGVMDEWHQFYLPGRHPGWDDLMADGIGSLVGAALLFLRKRSPNQHS